MFIRIHCGYCKRTYEVYERDDLQGDRARVCPHCSTKIDRETWLFSVVPAFKAASDANRKLYEDHVNKHNAIFTVAFVPDHIFE